MFYQTASRKPAFAESDAAGQSLSSAHPELTPLSVTLAEDTRIVVTTTNLSALGGETEFDQPEHGRVVLELVGRGPEANIVYIPDRDYFGPDNFTLRYVSFFDETGDGVTTQEVAITVTPVDEAPIPAASGYARGTAGTDVLDYSAFTTRLLVTALDGDDTLRGGSANDALNGGAGNDVISGGAGADFITGGTGVDRMAGGAGSDTFVLARGDLALSNTTDHIVDFEGAGGPGGDMIRFVGFGPGATLELVEPVNNALAYEVRDASGAALGRLLVSAFGPPLEPSDYVFV